MLVVLSEGDHVVEGSWTDPYGSVRENTLGITCSNISFIGQSKDRTTVHGGWWIWCAEQKECDGEEFDFDNIVCKRRKLQWK